MPTLTRGPLPARVYWVRRMTVLGVALLLVVGIARLLAGGSGGSSGDAEASAVAAEVSGSPSGTASSTPGWYEGGPTSLPTAHPGGTGSTRPPALAAPEGDCSDRDVTVTPKVSDAVAGRDVTIVLELRTSQSPACTWHVSPKTLTLKITSGSDQIWSSLQCPKAIPVQDVVVRRAATTRVPVVWKEARRSDDSCSNRTEWAMPGWYHVTAAALAGEPSDEQFELQTPASATITRTATPEPSPSDGRSDGRGDGRGDRRGHGRDGGQAGPPSAQPSASPSGAAEPD